MANQASRTPKRSFAIGSGKNLMFPKASVTAVSKALSFEKLVSTLIAMTVDKRPESIPSFVSQASLRPCCIQGRKLCS